MSDGAAQRHRLRVLVTRQARVDFWSDSFQPAKAPEDVWGRDPELILIDRRGEVFRTVYDSTGVRLLLQVHADDCYDTILQPTPVHLQPKLQSVSGTLITGVEVAPGCVVSRRGESGMWVMISGQSAMFTFSGWVPGEVVGKGYPVDEKPEQYRKPDLYIASEDSMWSAPHGQVIGRFIRTSAQVQSAGAEVDGYTPIHYQGIGYRATGYVKSDSLGPIDEVPERWGSMGYPMDDRDGSRLYLPTGTGLHARPGGDVVGIVTEPMVKTVSNVKDGWWFLPGFRTPWRSFHLWVEDNGPAMPGPDRRIIYRDLQQYDI